jgi:PEP-CTERM motif-containing protein
MSSFNLSRSAISCGLCRALSSMALGAITLLFAPHISAAAQSWMFDHVRFSSGATLSGSFTYDADVGTYGTYVGTIFYLSDPCFLTSQTTGACGIIYSIPSHLPQAVGAVDNFATPLSFNQVRFSYTYPDPASPLATLDLAFASPLGEFFGVPGNIGVSGIHNWQLQGTWYQDQITSGFVVNGIPEPETYALLLAGLGVLSFMRRRAKRKAVG